MEEIFLEAKERLKQPWEDLAKSVLCLECFTEIVSQWQLR